MKQSSTDRSAKFIRYWLTTQSVLTFGFLYLPIVVLVLFSFNGSRVLAFPLENLSFHWYRVLFADTDMHQSVLNSLTVAALSVPICLALGTPIAFLLDRYNFFGKGILERMLLLPLIVPGLITGLSILILLNRAGLGLSLRSVLVGHSIFLTPIVVSQIYARLRRFDRSIENASLDLGANRVQTFLYVTLPNIKTAMIGSGLLVFTLSFDEIAITFFLTGTENTLPMHIWSMLREGVTPEINAIASISIVISLLLIVVSLRFLKDSSTHSAD